jgi:hypothetical protein
VPERRASRFAAEVLFLAALAVGLAFAQLRPLVIGGVMLLGWLIVALLEWAAWRDEPHYGSGLPPRYYVPQVSLPPRRPLEQVGSGYPAAEQRDEAPTWIASPALRAEVLASGNWPVATPQAADEDTQADDEQTDETPESSEVGWERDSAGGGDDQDPWTVSAPESPREHVELVDLVATAERTAVHRLDPLAEPEQKRRLWRRRQEENGVVTIEVPARPTGPRVLPGRARSED